MKRLVLLCALSICSPGVQADEGAVLQELSERMQPPPGIVKFRLSHEPKNFNSTTLKGSISRQESDINILFESFTRGRVARILSLESGDEVYLFRYGANKLEDFSSDPGLSKIAGTNFMVQDLSGAPLSHTFYAESAPPDIWNGETLQRLYLTPIRKGSPVRLLLWYRALGELEPVKVDYYQSGVLTRQLEVTCGTIPKRTENGDSETTKACYRYRLVHLASSSYSVMEWLIHDVRQVLDPRYFELKNIRE